MIVIICDKYKNNPSRTVDATERTRFSKSRPNDLEDIGQGQRSWCASETSIPPPPPPTTSLCGGYNKKHHRLEMAHLPANSPAWRMHASLILQQLTHSNLFSLDLMVGPWWRHQMKTFSALLAIFAGNSPVTGEFPAKRPATHSFDVFFQMCLNRWLGEQSWGWRFETSSRPLFCHWNVAKGLWLIR